MKKNKEEIKNYHKSKEYKRKLLKNIILFLLFIAIIYCCYLFYQKTYPKKANENINYNYEIENNTILLSSGNKVLNTHDCHGACSIYKKYFNEGYILLKENNNIYLYNLVDNKKVSPNLKEVYFIYNNKGQNINNVEYFVIVNTNNKYGVMDKKGNVTINISYDNIGYIKNETLTNYSSEYGFIAVKNNNLWGLLELKDSKGVLDFQYQDIIVTEYNKLAVKLDNLWYLVDNDNKKIISTGYDYMEIFNKYLLVTSANQAYLVDFKGNEISDKINLTMPADYHTHTGIEAIMDNGKLIINVLDNNGNKQYSYIYNEMSKKLEAN